MGFRADQMSDLEGGEQIEDPKFDVECAIKVCVQMSRWDSGAGIMQSRNQILGAPNRDLEINLTPSQTSTDTVNLTPSQTSTDTVNPTPSQT